MNIFGKIRIPEQTPKENQEWWFYRKCNILTNAKQNKKIDACLFLKTMITITMSLKCLFAWFMCKEIKNTPFFSLLIQSKKRWKNRLHKLFSPFFLKSQRYSCLSSWNHRLDTLMFNLSTRTFWAKQLNGINSRE